MQQAEVTIISERWLCNFIACNPRMTASIYSEIFGGHLIEAPTQGKFKKIRWFVTISSWVWIYLQQLLFPTYSSIWASLWWQKVFLYPSQISLFAISLYCLSAHSCAPPSIPHNFSGSLQCHDLKILEKTFAVTEREKTFGPRPGWKWVEVCCKEINLCSLLQGKNIFRQFVKKHNDLKEDHSFYFSFERKELLGPDWE